MHKLLIVDREKNVGSFFEEVLAAKYDTSVLHEGDDVYQELNSSHYDAVIMNVFMEWEEAFNLLNWLKSSMPNIPVVILTSKSETTELAVKAIKQGAFDFITKPSSSAQIVHTLTHALETRGMINEIDYLRHEQDIIYNFDKIVVRSPVMQDVVQTLKKFSQTDSTITIIGETGTGKSFLSGTLHYNSPRKNKPFIKINCANIPETLLESELFGHEKGAFSGADKTRIGRFEQAQGGTVFLDEIGELSMGLQAKLLRVTEEKAFERIGGNKTIHSDVRVIAATNRNLEMLIAEKKFREDLFYRISVLLVELPPLRLREQCIEPLAHQLLKKTSRSLKKKITGFSPSVINYIKTYSWPGNIRQLANTIERAAILEDSMVIQEKRFIIPEHVGKKQVITPPAPSATLTLQEKSMILKALENSLWIQKDAAGLLGISPRALNYKIKKFGITHSRWRKNKTSTPYP